MLMQLDLNQFAKLWELDKPRLYLGTKMLRDLREFKGKETTMYLYCFHN